MCCHQHSVPRCTALQSNMIQFKPPLSQNKKNALVKMRMGSYTKIYVQFKKPVLTQSGPLILQPTNCGWARNMHNLNKKPFLSGSDAGLANAIMRRKVLKGDALGIALTAVNQVVNLKVGRKVVAQYVYMNFHEDLCFQGARYIYTISSCSAPDAYAPPYQALSIGCPLRTHDVTLSSPQLI